MNKPLSPALELRQIRRTIGISQGDMGTALGGIKQATYSNYENGLRELPDGLLDQAKQVYRARMGAEWKSPIGVQPGHKGTYPVQAPDNLSGTIHGTSKVTGDIRARDEDDYGGTRAPGILSEHISEAWSILHEAGRSVGADIMAMDVAAVGVMLGSAAEAVAGGRGQENRMRAVRRAEVVFRAIMGKALP